MPERSWRFRISDMLDGALKIERYTAGMDEHAFRNDEKTIDAVVRNLEIIGVASRHVPDDARETMPEVAWRQIWGMRNRLAHDYLNLDIDIIWETVQQRILDLIVQLRSITQKTSEGD